MPQDERCFRRYHEVMDFMGNDHRNPSEHYPEDELKHH